MMIRVESLECQLFSKDKLRVPEMQHKQMNKRSSVLVVKLRDLFQIKEEAARRRALREAKKKEQEAIDAAAKVKSEEEIMAELAYTRARAESAEGHAAAAAQAEEKARRAAKKAELNAKWGGGGPK
jgi:hypothetical protein